MGFRQLSLSVIGLVGIFLCGIGGVVAWSHQLYASVLVTMIMASLLSTLILQQRLFLFGVHRPYFRTDVGGAAIDLGHRQAVLLDQAPSPMLLQEEGGPVIAVNRAARLLFDTSRELSRNTRTAFLTTGGGTVREMPGRIKWRDQTYAVHLCDIEEGDRLSHLAVLTDISAEVRAAEAAALRDLLQVLNHELMNALTPVASLGRSALDLMDVGTAAAQDSAKRALTRVVARTEGLIDFVEAYRALTRLPEPTLRSIPLGPFMEATQHLFEAEWAPVGVALRIVNPDHPVHVLMDADQIQVCLLNLLKNAAYAAQESHGNAGGACVRLRWVVMGDQVAFTVEDNGPGIAATAASSIFLPFYTTKPKGSGVGLSLARQIMQGHGGTLDLMPDQKRPDGHLPGAYFQGVLRKG